MGLPVVASHSRGISQLINDGENGLLCEKKHNTLSRQHKLYI